MKSALRSWLLTSGPAPFCLCKPFSCKACPGDSPMRITKLPQATTMRVKALVESKTRTYHGQAGSGRHTAGRRGGAGRGRSRRRRVCSPRRHRTFLPSRVSTTTVLDDFPEARTSEILCKPMGGKNMLCPAFYPRLISVTKSTLRSWLLTSGPSPCCLCKPFSCKACPGTNR